jgi:hypothetical protein
MKGHSLLPIDRTALITLQTRENSDPVAAFLLMALSTYCKLEVTEAPAEVRLRLHQLLRQIFSSDSVLQLITPDAIPYLTSYSDGNEPDPRLSALVPAFGMLHMNLDGTPASASVEVLLRPLCGVLAGRAQVVYDDLIRSREVVVQPSTDWHAGASDLDWRWTGSYYGKPPCRPRPFYEGKDVAETGNFESEGSCRKLYTTYGKKTLTGGLMALWCPHLICLGFHKIPVAEGRNDVFSAIYQYWEKAPKAVIYDFGCQLGPYCMSREPEFFRDTLFAIDEMHANGHNNCSQACYVSNYMLVRPHLMRVNSSAAECNNAGLNRIRKSISYMDQPHAILFTYMYVNAMNRKKERYAKAELERLLLDTRK